MDRREYGESQLNRDGLNLLSPRSNWARIGRYYGDVDKWEKDAEAVCSIDVDLYETYSYHPSPWPDLASLTSAYRPLPEINDRRDRPIPKEFKPLSAQEYAKAFGLVVLKSKLYEGRGMREWTVPSTYSLRKRGKEGEFGSYVLYGKADVLVRPDAVEADIERIVSQQNRFTRPETYEAHWTQRESPIVYRVVPQRIDTLDLSIQMYCHDCDVSWNTAGTYTDFCPHCYRRNVSEKT